MIWKAAGVSLLMAIACLLSGCGGSGPVPVPMDGGSAKSIMGGGSSFAYPIMNRWTSEYNKQTGVQVNYQSLGSSGGIKQFSVKTLDFGATDAPMNEEQLQAAKSEVLHIPVVMGAVAITYNLPGVKGQLSISGPALADIYLGKIKKWNDPVLVALNPGLKLPDAEIVTARRADGSGTTFLFAEFLGKCSPEWKQTIGVGNSLSWPANSIGGKGNEGVAALVVRSPNSLGYVELVYAIQTKMSVAAVINSAGKSVLPSVQSVTAAAADLTTVPADLRLSITNAPGENSYPIAGITWLVARPEMHNRAKAQSLKDFILYTLSEEAQSIATSMDYSRLPEKLLIPARDNANKIIGTK